MTPSTPGKKHTIRIAIAKGVDGKYVPVGGKVDRIGDLRGNNLTWEIENQTQGEIWVTISNFEPATRCPLEDHHDFRRCRAKVRIPSRPGPPWPDEKIKGKLADRVWQRYSYTIRVAGSEHDPGDLIDPELQIDDGDPNPLSHGKLIAILIALGLIGFGAWFALRSSS